MMVDDKILSVFKDDAKEAIIERITIGVGYTSVLLSDGRCGLCSTLLNRSKSCIVNKDPEEYEKHPAYELLRSIMSDHHLARVQAIATANALNHSFAGRCPDDQGDLMKVLHIPDGGKVGMVGHFEPVVSYLSQCGVEVKSYDLGKQIGSEAVFYDWAKSEADAMVITATSLIDGSIIHIFDMLGGKIVPTVLMGPSTIIRPEIYGDLPISVYAGTVPVDTASIERIVRNGRGTRDIHKYARKVHLLV